MLSNQQRDKSCFGIFPFENIIPVIRFRPLRAKDKNNTFITGLVDQHSVPGILPDLTSGHGAYHRCKPLVLLYFYHA